MMLLDRQKEFTRLLVTGFPEMNLTGLPLKSSSAVTGNATQENLVQAVTTGPKDHGSDGALQWRLTRLDGPRGLKGWSAAQGLNWATLKAQAAFFLWELHQDYPALEKDLREGKKSIETLTANVCKFYERPNMALAHLDKRISHAKSVYSIMSKEAAPSTAAATATITAAGASAAGAASLQFGGDTFQTFLAVGAMALVGLAAYALLKWKEQPAKVAPEAAPVGADLPSRIEALTHALEAVAKEAARLSERLDELKALAVEPKAETSPTGLDALAEHLSEAASAETDIQGLS